MYLSADDWEVHTDHLVVFLASELRFTSYVGGGFRDNNPRGVTCQITSTETEGAHPNLYFSDDVYERHHLFKAHLKIKVGRDYTIYVKNCSQFSLRRPGRWGRAFEILVSSAISELSITGFPLELELYEVPIYSPPVLKKNISMSDNDSFDLEDIQNQVRAFEWREDEEEDDERS